MIDFTNHMKSREVKSIRQGDPKFMLNDGLVMYPRAMIHILPECPANARHLIEWAISEGYLKTVAHVYGKELTMDSLR
jgi:hypothetical protein